MIYVIFIYAIAMTLANLLVAQLGPWVTPINSFFLIGLDLTLRDWLHYRIKPLKMLALILATGALTFALNPAAGMIAVASAASFTASALVDWAAFTKLTGSWSRRVNGSNVAGAAVDSLLFPTIAFGALMPHIVSAQFVAKVAGGFVWGLAIQRAMKLRGVHVGL